ncbi:MAG: ATP-dependent RecD-like DNA helicase [Phycisphaerae bacterium]|nr:ATP-dependent RecD-like DNA helicase [Phycisphaerae bacterium]
MEKKGGEQRYELHAGQRVTPEKSPYTIYRFTLADSTLVPEDASGTLDVEGRQFKATVVAQEYNRVDVQLEAAEALDLHIARALLRVDDLGLLRKLADALDAVAAETEAVSALTADMFHPKSNGACKAALPAIPALNRITGEQRNVIEQASASDITFVWGPPGTGKTYVIAHLIAALVARGERVLMTSHTHAAVDQSIYETVKPDVGPLADSDFEREGKIVRIGRVTNPKVPEAVRLDRIVERRAQEIQSEISELQRRAAPLSATRAPLNAQLAEWNRLSELRRRLVEVERQASESASSAALKTKEHSEAIARFKACAKSLEKADRVWFFRETRISRAKELLAEAKRAWSVASAAATSATAAARCAEQASESLRVETNRQSEMCERLPTLEALKQQLAPIETELGQIEHRLTELRARLDVLEREVIAEARVVAATLTKCYVGNQLDGHGFDALIVDEISMALPPLLFMAGRRALRRVILVGDFKQLSPIVRSDNEITNVRLRQDAFHLSGIARDLEPTNHRALSRLHTQRRMLRPIADVARAISYGPKGLSDHADVLKRTQPDWLTFLPSNALTLVDTADLHAWCGRQAGSLSRFNLYSAQIAAELAAMAAAGIPKPDQANAPPIGIVTPYAAQRRLLSRLIQALELSAWVAVGTVHTFQGGEAELIIFDTVLDEPYWTARLCNPNQSKEVKRDLNVAVTRARSKFVLIGSSEWLNRHAKPTSGLGQLWHYLKDHADLVSALEMVEVGFAGRVAQASATYHIPGSANVPAHSILDEDNFFDLFFKDLRAAKESVFGLVPFFGEYRWPTVEPLVRQALERGVEVTLVTPPPSEAENRSYVEKAICSLRQLGAVVVSAMGLHGKDIVIDGRIHYTGSLNWASHRGRAEIMHRTENADYARTVLDYLQARHIRAAAGPGAHPRTCPQCQGATQVVNQARPMSQWDKQPMKIGCADYQSTGCKYLVDINQRAPFLEPPLCSVDHKTKYRRVRRGKGESWECPKHPKECPRHKVTPDDCGGVSPPFRQPETLF